MIKKALIFSATAALLAGCSTYQESRGGAYEENAPYRDTTRTGGVASPETSGAALPNAAEHPQAPGAYQWGAGGGDGTSGSTNGVSASPSDSQNRR